MLYNISTPVFYFNELFFRKKQSKYCTTFQWLHKGHPLCQLLCKLGSSCVSKTKQKCLHLDDLGFLELVLWEDIFTAINQEQYAPELSQQ